MPSRRKRRSSSFLAAFRSWPPRSSSSFPRSTHRPTAGATGRAISIREPKRNRWSSAPGGEPDPDRGGAGWRGSWSPRPEIPASAAHRESAGSPTAGSPCRGGQRTMRVRTAGSIGGRPGRPLLSWLHFLLRSSWCHRSNVCGLTMNEDQVLLGMARLAAASRTRSTRWSRGRVTWRCRILTWCRSTSSSMSRSSGGRRPVPIMRYRCRRSADRGF
jgi:hypothetical protein